MSDVSDFSETCKRVADAAMEAGVRIAVADVERVAVVGAEGEEG
ncbi:hypothetical protein [uncultured Bradyrhizobium sp.]|nr:hypothetical protein [uncultured Bradyrhizobium sp.]